MRSEKEIIKRLEENENDMKKGLIDVHEESRVMGYWAALKWVLEDE
jgi:uncharacterized protein (UPF0335 family)